MGSAVSIWAWVQVYRVCMAGVGTPAHCQVSNKKGPIVGWAFGGISVPCLAISIVAPEARRYAKFWGREGEQANRPIRTASGLDLLRRSVQARPHQIATKPGE